jgi:protein gp37
MSTGTGIEWTEATWNPIAGCTPVSPGCLNCYAATMSARLAAMGQAKYVGLTVKRDGRQVFNGKINFDNDALLAPFKWKKPRVVFVNSMSDLFHEDVPVEFIWKVFAIMASTPQHTYQILTKRPERMAEILTLHNGAAFQIGVLKAAHLIPGQEVISGGWSYPLSNVWLGTSCEDQQRADERIPHLLKCPGSTLFLSLEPLLGPIDYLASWLVGCNDQHLRPRAECDRLAKRDRNLRSIHWVIVGGESGAKPRPCGVHWVRSIVRQCDAAGVPCFVKQLGANLCMEFADGALGDRIRLHDAKGGDPDEWAHDLRVRQMPRVPVPA